MSNKTSDNSVANIEENIKTIKNLLQMLENGFLTEEMCPIRSWDPTPKYASALKYILAEREQKDKRIKELEADLYSANEIIADLTDSIPKQVVIDKMEELNKEIKSCDEIDAIFKIKQQQVLQELLEGERK